MEFISSFFSTPLWHFFDNPLCKNQKIRFIRSTRENIKKRHRNIEKKIRSLASGNVLTQGFFSPERKGKKNSAVSRKRRKRKFLQVSLLKKCKVGVRRDTTQSWEASIYADCKQICLVIGNEMATFCDYSKDINFIS